MRLRSSASGSFWIQPVRLLPRMGLWIASQRRLSLTSVIPSVRGPAKGVVGRRRATGGRSAACRRDRLAHAGEDVAAALRERAGRERLDRGGLGRDVVGVALHLGLAARRGGDGEDRECGEERLLR